MKKKLLYMTICLLYFIILIQNTFHHKKHHKLHKRNDQKNNKNEQVEETKRIIKQIPLSSKKVPKDKQVENFNLYLKENAKINKLTTYKQLVYNAAEEKIDQIIENLSIEDLKSPSFLQVSQAQGIPLRNHQNIYYTGPVSVATPDNEFDVIFDTGSNLIFINSVYCDDNGCVRGPLYNSDESQTHEDLLTVQRISYGSGDIDGAVGVDTFFCAGMEIPNTRFLEVTDSSGAAFDSNFEGLVGLSYPMHSDGEKGLFDMMLEQNLLEQPMFAFYMNRQSGSSNSALTFGGYSEEYYIGDLNWHRVSEPFFWAIQAQQILVGDEDTEICSSQYPCKLVIDSGTSLISGPEFSLVVLFEYLNYYRELPEEGETLDECQTFRSLPPIVFVIDGIKYPLYPEDYIITASNDAEVEPYKHADPEDIVFCQPTFFPLDYPEPIGPLWIIGDIFLSRYYSVFDRGNNRIGFGKAAGLDH